MASVFLLGPRKPAPGRDGKRTARDRPRPAPPGDEARWAGLPAMRFCAQAQSPLQPGGFYISAEGGANWMFNTSFTSTLNVAPLFVGSTTTNASFNTGFVV